MKIQVTFKTPDALEYAARNYAEFFVNQNAKLIEQEYDGDVELFISDKKEEFEQFAKRWIEYGECVTLEIDTELNTCVVLEN